MYWTIVVFCYTVIPVISYNTALPLYPETVLEAESYFSYIISYIQIEIFSFNKFAIHTLLFELYSYTLIVFFRQKMMAEKGGCVYPFKGPDQAIEDIHTTGTQNYSKAAGQTTSG